MTDQKDAAAGSKKQVCGKILLEDTASNGLHKCTFAFQVRVELVRRESVNANKKAVFSVGRNDTRNSLVGGLQQTLKLFRECLRIKRRNRQVCLRSNERFCLRVLFIHCRCLIS